VRARASGSYCCARRKKGLRIEETRLVYVGQGEIDPNAAVASMQGSPVRGKGRQRLVSLQLDGGRLRIERRRQVHGAARFVSRAICASEPKLGTCVHTSPPVFVRKNVRAPESVRARCSRARRGNRWIQGSIVSWVGCRGRPRFILAPKEGVLDRTPCRPNQAARSALLARRSGEGGARVSTRATPRDRGRRNLGDGARLARGGSGERRASSTAIHATHRQTGGTLSREERWHPRRVRQRELPAPARGNRRRS